MERMARTARQNPFSVVFFYRVWVRKTFFVAGFQLMDRSAIVGKYENIS